MCALIRWERRQLILMVSIHLTGGRSEQTGDVKKCLRDLPLIQGVSGKRKPDGNKWHALATYSDFVDHRIRN